MQTTSSEGDARRAEIEALAASIAEITAHCDVLYHERIRHIRRFDEIGGWGEHGAKSCAHWLMWRGGLSGGAAREQVRVARALTTLPLIDAEFASGRLSFSKVRAMTRVAKPENEATLLDLALNATASQIETLCRKFRTVVDPHAVSAETYVRRTDL